MGLLCDSKSEVRAWQASKGEAWWSVVDGDSKVNSVVVDLALSPEQYVEYYRGSARRVVARATDGRWIQFPASVLQRFVTANGIHGQFRLSFDLQNRFVAIERWTRPEGLDATG